MATIYNKYSSIVPSEMSNNELRQMCTELQTAKNWGLQYATIVLPSGVYKNNVSRLKDYQKEYKTETNQIKI